MYFAHCFVLSANAIKLNKDFIVFLESVINSNLTKKHATTKAHRLVYL